MKNSINDIQITKERKRGASIRGEPTKGKVSLRDTTGVGGS